MGKLESEAGVTEHLIAGIDPGRASGALSVWAGDHLEIYRMPVTAEGLLDLLKALSGRGVDKVILERVGGHRPGNSAVATASFNRHLGELDMALIATGLWPVTVRVVPIKWQRALATFSRDKATRKREIVALMKKQWPSYEKKINLKTADSLGILTYGLGSLLP